jgi:hypothetical protein
LCWKSKVDIAWILKLWFAVSQRMERRISCQDWLWYICDTMLSEWCLAVRTLWSLHESSRAHESAIRNSQFVFRFSTRMERSTHTISAHWSCFCDVSKSSESEGNFDFSATFELTSSHSHYYICFCQSCRIYMYKQHRIRREFPGKTYNWYKISVSCWKEQRPSTIRWKIRCLSSLFSSLLLVFSLSDRLNNLRILPR